MIAGYDKFQLESHWVNPCSRQSVNTGPLLWIKTSPKCNASLYKVPSSFTVYILRDDGTVISKKCESSKLLSVRTLRSRVEFQLCFYNESLVCEPK